MDEITLEGIISANEDRDSKNGATEGQGQRQGILGEKSRIMHLGKKNLMHTHSMGGGIQEVVMLETFRRQKAEK